MTPVQALKIMRAADTYAMVAVQVHSAKGRARRTGDSLRRFDRRRDAARARLTALLNEIAGQNAPKV